MTNRAFWRAIHSLAHPISIGAVLMLLLNDHYFRQRWPSWWTGKTGDFAWLIFAPLVAATAIAWVLPRRQRKQESIVGIIAFSFTGLWFAGVKISPAINKATVVLIDIFVDWNGSLLVDPGDLIALPALLIGWHIWQQAKNAPLQPPPRSWVVLALGMVLTLAWQDGLSYEPVANAGIVCLNQDKLFNRENLVVTTFVPRVSPHYFIRNYDVFSSIDGGMNWETKHVSFEIEATGYSYLNFDGYEPTDIEPTCDERQSHAIDPLNPSIELRFIPGDSIQRSTDGGQAWKVVYDLSFLKQEIRKYYHHNRNAEWEEQIIDPGPFDVIYHPYSRNFVFAMGWEGVLVYTHSGNWKWVSFNRYSLVDFKAARDDLTSILHYELWLAGALFFLVLNTASIRILSTTYPSLGLALLGWAIWLVLVISCMPLSIDSSEDRYVGFVLLALPTLVFLAIPASAVTLWNLIHHKPDFLIKIMPICLITATLFLLPYVLWTQGTILRYQTATQYALILTVGTLIACYATLRQIARVQKLSN